MSVPILPPINREIQALWYQNDDTEILDCNAVVRVDNAMAERRMKATMKQIKQWRVCEYTFQKKYLPSAKKGNCFHTKFLAGMWITADFRLYPPVITANQELVSPTGDHRYRGGTERAHPRGFWV